MRSILFSPVMQAGGLFLLGVPVSNWRHVIVSARPTDRRRPRHPRPHRGRSDRQWGYVRFNAVLAPLAVFILVAEDPRLAALGALVATWIFSLSTSIPCSPRSRRVCVLSVWALMLLRWINPASSASPLGPRLRLRPPAESACQGKDRIGSAARCLPRWKALFRAPLLRTTRAPFDARSSPVAYAAFVTGVAWM